MKTRVGKIARLPKILRDQLNQQLENGVRGNDILTWLNALPEVQKVLAEQFGGRPINKQNISEWRHGGYVDWARSRDGRQHWWEMMETAGKLTEARDHAGVDTSRYLGTILLIELLTPWTNCATRKIALNAANFYAPSQSPYRVCKRTNPGKNFSASSIASYSARKAKSRAVKPSQTSEKKSHPRTTRSSPGSTRIPRVLFAVSPISRNTHRHPQMPGVSEIGCWMLYVARLHSRHPEPNE